MWAPLASLVHRNDVHGVSAPRTCKKSVGLLFLWYINQQKIYDSRDCTLLWLALTRLEATPHMIAVTHQIYDGARTYVRNDKVV